MNNRASRSGRLLRDRAEGIDGTETSNGASWRVSDVAGAGIATGRSVVDRPEALSLRAATAVALDAMKSGALSKLDTRLAALFYEQSPQAASMSAFTAGVSQYDGALSKDGSFVLIDTTARDGNGAALLTSLQALGLKGGSSFGAVASGWIPKSALGALAATSQLGFARESAFTTSVGLVTTQADSAERADVARAATGATGAGVRVGVLSDSFDTGGYTSLFTGYADNMASNIGTNDLPRDTRILQDADGEDEGRAMGQLVHDLAPGAAIDFATAFGGQAGFANNILSLGAAGDKVIVDDVSYFGELNYQNGVISQAINQVVGQGVAYFTSAGNNGSQGYEGVWNGGGTTSMFGKDYQMMQFAPGQDYLEVTNPADTTITLQWDQPGASAGGTGATSDLDLFLIDTDGNTVWSFSTDNNQGGDPIEGFKVPSFLTDTYRLAIGLASGSDAPGLVRLVAFGNGLPVQFQDIASNINPGTVTGHAGAAGAMAVGAAPFFGTPAYNPALTTGVAEPFTSGGYVKTLFDDEGNRLATPLVNGVAFTAVDGGNTTFFGQDTTRDPDPFPNFFGTSAAAPDAAAVAALMLQINPALTNTDLRTLLQYSAIDMDDPTTAGFDAGRDRLTGAGLIQADVAARLATVRDLRNSTDAQLSGTSLADTITAGALDNVINAGGGDDTVFAGDGTDRVSGGAGMDMLYGNQGNDTLYGEDGDDRLYGGKGDDFLYGGAGDDVLEGGLGTNVLNGGAGTANIASYSQSATAVTVNLGDGSANQTPGNDTYINIQGVEGSGFADTLTGDTGTNVIRGDAGDDVIHGDSGDSLLGSGYADDDIDGGAGNDVILGDSVPNDNYGGNDTINGGAGADLLQGGGGNDILDGGGADQPLIRVTVNEPDIIKPASEHNDSLADAVVLNTAAGGDFDLVSNPAIVDSQVNPHATIFATFSNYQGKEYYAFDVGAGAKGIFDIDSNRLDPSVGGYFSTRMTLYDAAGNQLITNDMFSGEDQATDDFFAAYFQYQFTDAGRYYVTIEDSGETPYHWDGGTDYPTYTLNVSLSSAGVVYEPGFAIQADDIQGGEGNDTSTYDNATNGVTVNLNQQLGFQGLSVQHTGYGDQFLASIENLTGSSYDDVLTGNSIANILTGGFGQDLLIGGNGEDRLYGNQGDDTLYGNQARDRMYGGQGNDTLYGGQGDDIMSGNMGNDILQGGVGADVLYGNDGADTFRYVQAADSVAGSMDTITDFQVGIDKVDLRAVHTSLADTFAITNDFGNSVLTVDQGGDGTEDMRIFLTGAAGFSATDVLWNQAATTSPAASAMLDPTMQEVGAARSFFREGPSIMGGRYHANLV